MVAEQELTKDEASLYKMLSDGMWHSKKELHCCLWDHEQSHFPSALQVRLSQLRKRLRPHGLDVFSARDSDNRFYGYRMARLISRKE